MGQEKKADLNRHSDFHVVATPAELKEMVAVLEKEKALGIDLEADSMYHFAEKICLIQIATEKAGFVIDTLALEDISLLKPIFYSTDIQKIFHGSDYDIRSLYRDYRMRVNSLFDTQLACRFLGMQETGLDAVLFKFFDIRLDKKYQKKDWSKRPLPDEMLAYAAKDVLYLVALGKLLENELEQKARLFWVNEESRWLSRLKPSANEAEPLFLRFKGAGRLDPRELAILEAILKYRKTVAKQKDRPMFKIFSNAAVLKIVKTRPLTIGQLEKTGALSRKQIGMYGEALIQKVQQALAKPGAELLRYPHKRAPMVKPKIRRRIKALKTWRENKARQIGIEPALVCSKVVMADLAAKLPNRVSQLKEIKDMRTWQKKVWGEEIITLLRETDGRRN